MIWCIAILPIRLLCPLFHVSLIFIGKDYDELIHLHSEKKSVKNYEPNMFSIRC